MTNEELIELLYDSTWTNHVDNQLLRDQAARVIQSLTEIANNNKIRYETAEKENLKLRDRLAHISTLTHANFRENCGTCGIVNIIALSSLGYK